MAGRNRERLTDGTRNGSLRPQIRRMHRGYEIVRLPDDLDAELLAQCVDRRVFLADALEHLLRVVRGRDIIITFDSGVALGHQDVEVREVDTGGAADVLDDQITSAAELLAMEGAGNLENQLFATYVDDGRILEARADRLACVHDGSHALVPGMLHPPDDLVRGRGRVGKCRCSRRDRTVTLVRQEIDGCLQSVRTAAERSDDKELARQVHRMAGCAAMVGASALHAACGEVERACKAGRGETARKRAAELPDLVAASQSVLAEFVEESAA